MGISTLYCMSAPTSLKCWCLSITTCTLKSPDCPFSISSPKPLKLYTWPVIRFVGVLKSTVLGVVTVPLAPQLLQACTTIFPEPLHCLHTSLRICLKNALPTIFSIWPLPLHMWHAWTLPPLPLHVPHFISLLYFNFLTLPKNTSSKLIFNEIFKLLPFLVWCCAWFWRKNWLNTSSILGPLLWCCLPWNGLLNLLS